MRREKSSPHSLTHLHAFIEEGGGEDHMRARRQRECERGEDEKIIFLLLPLTCAHERVQERRKERKKEERRERERETVCLSSRFSLRWKKILSREGDMQRRGRKGWLSSFPLRAHGERRRRRGEATCLPSLFFATEFFCHERGG